MVSLDSKYGVPRFLVSLDSKAEAANGFSSLERLNKWYAEDLSSVGLVDSAIEGINNQETLLVEALSTTDLLSESVRASLVAVKSSIVEKLQTCRDEEIERQDRRSENAAGDRQERWHEERYELEYGPFADVDE